MFWSFESHNYHTTKLFDTMEWCVICKHAYHIYLIWFDHHIRVSHRNIKYFIFNISLARSSINYKYTRTHTYVWYWHAEHTSILYSSAMHKQVVFVCNLCDDYGRFCRWMFSYVCLCTFTVHYTGYIENMWLFMTQ